MTLEVVWTRENGGDWKFKTFQMDIITTQGQDSHVVTLTRSSLSPIAGYLFYVYTLLFSIATLSLIENITVTSVNRQNNTMIHRGTRHQWSLLYALKLQQKHQKRDTWEK